MNVSRRKIILIEMTNLLAYQHQPKTAICHISNISIFFLIPLHLGRDSLSKSNCLFSKPTKCVSYTVICLKIIVINSHYDIQHTTFF